MSTKIILKKLIIKNFKGIKHFEIEFNNTETSIFGANEAGKTSVYDAYCWLLFGKDSSDREDFSIKPLDSNGKTNKDLETEVLVYINVNGADISLKRTYYEKWTKKRGLEEKEFTGNEQSFFYNEVPLKKGDYNLKIASIIDEKLFKLLSNPLYFNSAKVKWEERRQILINMAPPTSSEHVLKEIADEKNGNEIQNLISAINQNKSIKEFKAEIASKKKTIKNELDTLPSRIDEANRSLPTEIPVFSEVEKAIKTHEQEMENIDASIADRNKAVAEDIKRIEEKQKMKFELQSKLKNEQHAFQNKTSNAEFEIKNKHANKEREILNVTRNIEDNNNSISRNNNTINTLTTENNNIREQWKVENEKVLVFDENEFNCPACKQPLPEDKIENSKKELTASFNLIKSKKLENINKTGIENKATIESLTKKNNELIANNETLQSAKVRLEDELTIIAKELHDFKNNPTVLPDNIIQLQKEIDEIIIEDAPVVDIEDLKAQKLEHKKSIEELQAKLALKSVIERTNARIKELEASQSKYTQELTSLEKQEFVIDNYIKVEMNSVERSVNKLFSLVEFKMFEIQVNGGENPTCLTTMKGVPYSDVNTASKLQGGIDIINGLSKYYDYSVPMFLDNRESVTEIPTTDAQVINLIVSPEHKVLTVKI